MVKHKSLPFVLQGCTWLEVEVFNKIYYCNMFALLLKQKNRPSAVLFWKQWKRGVLVISSMCCKACNHFIWRASLAQNFYMLFGCLFEFFLRISPFSSLLFSLLAVVIRVTQTQTLGPQLKSTLTERSRNTASKPSKWKLWAGRDSRSMRSELRQMGESNFFK